LICHACTFFSKIVKQFDKKEQDLFHYPDISLSLWHMNRFIWVILFVVFGVTMSFAQGGNFNQSTQQKKSTFSSDLLDDIDLDEDPTTIFYETDSVTQNRFRQPMKFTRREMNKITDPRVRDMYWYALNDSTDRKRYLRAHYAFNGTWDNWAFDVRVGAQTVFLTGFETHFKLGPQIEFGFKKDIHPYWAGRITLSWSHLKHDVRTNHLSTMITDESYLRPDYQNGAVWLQTIEYTNLGLRFEVMLNMLNMFAGREVLYLPYSWFIYGGAGASYSAKTIGQRDGSCLVPQWLVGSQIGMNLTDRHSITVDLNGYWQGSDIEGYTTSNSSWKTCVLIGLSYKFSKNIHFQRLGYDVDFTRQQVLDAVSEGDVMQTVIESQRDVQEVQLPAEMIEAAFFQIDRVELQHTYVLNLGFYAELIKSHPTQKFLVKGFADIEVGSMKRNLWLCEQRAKVVADVLTRTYGVDPDQLVVGGGDLDIDIPFLREQGHHKFNRCTIVCPLNQDYKIVKVKEFSDKEELNQPSRIRKNY